MTDQVAATGQAQTTFEEWFNSRGFIGMSDQYARMMEVGWNAALRSRPTLSDEVIEKIAVRLHPCSAHGGCTVCEHARAGARAIIRVALQGGGE